MSCYKRLTLAAAGLTAGLIGGCSDGGEECEPHADTYCIDGATYSTDSCGELEEVLEMCNCGCTADHSACKRCDCESHADTVCKDGILYWMDSCGQLEEVIGECECEPSCAGKECGSDGCGDNDNCGKCEAGWTCSSGTCVNTELCNNNRLDTNEECEGFELRGQTCESLGYDGGDLSCSQDCTFDTSQCRKCGNGVIEPGETCDPPGSCPTACYDGIACTRDVMTGSAANCNVACSHPAIAECADGDGCCPTGCNATIDDDCSSSCGNDVIEPGETCDPPGSCPTVCYDGIACTRDVMTGSAANCNVACSHPAIAECADGDGCCPTGCNATIDDDCHWRDTSLTGAPLARYGHRAVWTGSEMIVWGGRDLDVDGSHFDTGGRYNPATNTWTAIGTTGAPSVRCGHTAVWTGSEMIVWGGSDSDGRLNTGGRYNPVANTWTVIGTTGAPSVRAGHRAVWTGEEMIVWGGHGANGDRYNPVTDSWATVSTIGAPSGWEGHTAVWTGSRMIAWGGLGGGSPQWTGGLYDPTTDTWEATSETGAPSSRYGHTAVWTGSEMIVWGGDRSGSLDTGGRYNPATNMWTAIGTTDAPSARSGHTAVWIGDEMIVWGGVACDSFYTGGLFVPAAEMWTTTSTLGAPFARYGHTAVWTGSEMIVWGGTYSVQTSESVCWMYVDVLESGGRYTP